MNLAELNNLLNSELTSKIKESKEENGELLINDKKKLNLKLKLEQ